MSASDAGTNGEITTRFKDLKWYVQLIGGTFFILTALAMIEMLFFALTGTYFLPGEPPPCSMLFGGALLFMGLTMLLMPNRETGNVRILYWLCYGFFTFQGGFFLLISLVRM